MNRTTKVIVSSMLAAGTVFGLGASVDTPQVNEAHAATTPYYSYQGYAGNNASFVLNQQFINSLKYDNFKLNGIHITATHGQKTVKKYDQEFDGVTKSGKSANSVMFKVTSKVTLKQLKNAYGKDLIEMKSPKGKNDPNDNTYIYKPAQNKPGVVFGINNGRLHLVSIGYVGVGA